VFNHISLLMGQPAQDGGGPGLMANVILFGSIILIFYFMIIRPQSKRQKEREKMLNAIQRGDKVITSGGIHGTISGLDDKTALVQIADNVKIKVDRSSITAVLTENSAPIK
jgi:preprotein translocase subunit YajC